MAAEREVTVKLGPGQHIAIVSDRIAGAYRIWSDPVEILAEPSRDGNPDVIEMVIRDHECPDPWSAQL